MFSGLFDPLESYKYIGKIIVPLGFFSRKTRGLLIPFYFTYGTTIYIIIQYLLYIAAICRFLNVSDVSELRARIVNENVSMSNVYNINVCFCVTILYWYIISERKFKWIYRFNIIWLLYIVFFFSRNTLYYWCDLLLCKRIPTVLDADVTYIYIYM